MLTDYPFIVGMFLSSLVYLKVLLMRMHSHTYFFYILSKRYAAVFAAFVAGMACLVGMDFGAKLLASLAKSFEVLTHSQVVILWIEHLYPQKRGAINLLVFVVICPDIFSNKKIVLLYAVVFKSIAYLTRLI